MASQAGFFEKTFKLSEHKTSLRTEIVAGLTTFMTMAYILAVNPNLLSATGMPSGELFTATVLASVIGTLAMALLANYPFALAVGFAGRLHRGCHLYPVELRQRERGDFQRYPPELKIWNIGRHRSFHRVYWLAERGDRRGRGKH